MSTHSGDRLKVPFWVVGDWNAFFGLGTNSILNILVLSGLLLGVVQMLPDREVPEGSVMDAAPEDLMPVGTLGAVVRMAKLADGSMRVMVMGLDRARLTALSGNGQ